MSLFREVIEWLAAIAIAGTVVVLLMALQIMPWVLLAAIVYWLFQ